MIGYYDYTVILTYMSLLSAVGGIALSTNDHPILATFCLMFSGMCDMFDGKVAQRKKNRTLEEKRFGIQIDSLVDVIAFGVLPGVMTIELCNHSWYAYIASAFYILAGVIRLGYYNVTEELRQDQTDELRKSYSGLPITTASMIFPFFYFLLALYCITLCHTQHFPQLFTFRVFRISLCSLTVLTGFAFICPFRIRKPHSRELWFFLGIGLFMAAVLLFVYLKVIAQ